MLMGRRVRGSVRRCRNVDENTWILNKSMWPQKKYSSGTMMMIGAHRFGMGAGDVLTDIRLGDGEIPSEEVTDTACSSREPTARGNSTSIIINVERVT